MYQSILAPVDGSPTGECALAHIKEVATGCSVPRVVLLFVVEPTQQSYEADTEFIAKARKRAKENAQEYLTTTAAKLKKEGLSVDTVLLHGKAVDQILDYVKKNQPDIVIMSTHGRSGITRWVMGSTTDRVMRHSPVPVFIVPPAGCRVS